MHTVHRRPHPGKIVLLLLHGHLQRPDFPLHIEETLVVCFNDAHQTILGRLKLLFELLGSGPLSAFAFPVACSSAHVALAGREQLLLIALKGLDMVGGVFGRVEVQAANGWLDKGTQMFGNEMVL